MHAAEMAMSQSQTWTPTKRFASNSTSTNESGVSDWGSWSEEHANNNIEDDRDEDDEEYEDYQEHVQEYPTTPRRDAQKCCNNSVWCIRDICGIICCVFTWGLLFYAEFVTMKIILLPSNFTLFRNVNLVIYNAFFILALTSHCRAMLTDPGAVPRGNATKEMINQMGLQQGQVIYKCQKCCSIKPPRAHHCSVCQRCIKKMDHHCPWVNNCVGEGNQKYFILFTLYICLISIHSLILAINTFVSCISHEWKGCSVYTPPATVIFLIFLIFEGLLFSIFTAVMLCTQLNSIWHDQTGIEQLKKEQVMWAKKSKWKSIQAVFGRFSISWLSPFTSPPKSSRAKISSYLSV